MNKDNALSSGSLEALQQRFQEQSRTAQAYYTIMHAMREVAGSDDAASAWMNTSLPAFSGKTPSELVKQGREEEVLAYVSSLKA
jgi:uncharacterized protein (DUF2384 family)